MGKLRRNYSRSFQHVQDRFTGEVGKLFDSEHHGRECTNTVFIRVFSATSATTNPHFATFSHCSPFAAILSVFRTG